MIMPLHRLAESQRDTSCDNCDDEEIGRTSSGFTNSLIKSDLPQPSRFYGVLMARLMENMSLTLNGH
jgi:hypothetical protein